jgi:hypothetical protein
MHPAVNSQRVGRDLARASPCPVSGQRILARYTRLWRSSAVMSGTS